MKKIAVLTGGGDCPSLTAMVRAIVKSADNYGLEVIGIRDGFRGAAAGYFFPLQIEDVSGILPSGGSIWGITGQDNPVDSQSASGGVELPGDRFGDVQHNLADQQVDVLLVIGGEDSISTALQLSELGLPVILIPQTNDDDRILANRLGIAAVEAAMAEQFAMRLVLQDQEIILVPIAAG